MLDYIAELRRKGDAKRFRLSKGDDGYERIVYAEVIVPDTLNAYNDYYSPRAVREFAYSFLISGFGIDEEHSESDISGQVYVVESFIARDSDPDFIPGSWVIGMYIKDDALWEKIKNNELNGFSYQAMVRTLAVEMDIPLVNSVTGQTEPDPTDGHRHDYVVILDSDGRIISGGTTEVDGHRHPITRHTFTGLGTEGDNRSHIFNYVRKIGDQ
jgi:hypothetical protein